MTDIAINSRPARGPDLSEARIKRRYAAERRFRLYGVLAISFSIFMLGFLAVTVIANGYTAFWQTRLELDVNLDPAAVDPKGNQSAESFAAADWQGVVKEALKAAFP